MAEADRVFVKCAWRLIPFMTLLYVVNFLNRVNVGFAALTMNQDLGFSPAVFGFGAGVLFVGYFLFQVPAALILERVGARRMVFCLLAIWGAISAACALVQGPTSFYVLRFLLGVAEAGFFPGMLLYLTYWFPQAYLARFTAHFMVAIPLSFAIGGPLSGLILGMDGIAGLHGWQWMFLIEGLPAFLLSFAALSWLPDRPAAASWLSADEKRTIAARLVTGTGTPVEDRNLLRGLRDPRVLALGVAYFCMAACAYGVEVWLPQIVQAMGFSNFATGCVVALPFMGGAGAMMLCGRSSSARGELTWHVALPWLFAAAGFAGASVAPSNASLLAALTWGLICMFAPFGPFYSMPASFLRGTAAAGGIAIFSAIGSLGGFFGPVLIGALKEGSGDYSTGLAAVALGFVLSALIVLAVGRGLVTDTNSA